MLSDINNLVRHAVESYLWNEWRCYLGDLDMAIQVLESAHATIALALAQSAYEIMGNYRMEIAADRRKAD